MSAPISVQAGQLLRIQAWVQVPRPLVPRWDGLLIYDNMSGEALAERITETQGWRELTLYRVATTTGDWRLHVALTGSGEAWVDEVSVTALGP